MRHRRNLVFVAVAILLATGTHTPAGALSPVLNPAAINLSSTFKHFTLRVEREGHLPYTVKVKNGTTYEYVAFDETSRVLNGVRYTMLDPVRQARAVLAKKPAVRWSTTKLTTTEAAEQRTPASYLPEILLALRHGKSTSTGETSFNTLFDVDDPRVSGFLDLNEHVENGGYKTVDVDYAVDTLSRITKLDGYVTGFLAEDEQPKRVRVTIDYRPVTILTPGRTITVPENVVDTFPELPAVQRAALDTATDTTHLSIAERVKVNVALIELVASTEPYISGLELRYITNGLKFTAGTSSWCVTTTQGGKAAKAAPCR